MSFTPTELLKKINRKIALFLRPPAYRPDIFDFEAVYPVAKSYKPKAYSGRVLLFKAMEKQHRHGVPIDFPELEWRKLVGEDLDIHEIPGNHLSLATDQGSIQIAHILMEAINSALDNGKRSPPLALRERGWG